MKVLIDTNILVDWLTAREPFLVNSEKVIRMCITGELYGYIASHTFPDLNYILRKQFSLEERREIFLMLCGKFTVIAESQDMLVRTFRNLDYKDMEDGLQMECAIESKLDYIVTRNIKDFKFSKTKVLLPEELFEHLY